MIQIKKSASNLMAFTLREKGSSSNSVIANYIANGYINVGYFQSTIIDSDDYVLEIYNNSTQVIKQLILKAEDNATSNTSRYDLWVLNEVTEDLEDLEEYKVNLSTGRYDYRVINSLSEVAESGAINVFDDSNADDFQIFATDDDDTYTTFK